MRKILEKFVNLILVFAMAFNPLCGVINVFAEEPVKGSLRVQNSDGSYTTSNTSVSVTEGSFENQGDVEVKKIVTKTGEGTYNVEFKVRGKNSSEIVSTPNDVYVVIVFDISNSMGSGMYSKYNKAVTAVVGGTLSGKTVKGFANELIDGGGNVKIGLVTFNTEASIKRNFANATLTRSNFPSASGATNIHDGLIKAKSLLDDIENENAKKYIVLMSDGEPTKYINEKGEAYGPEYEHDNTANCVAKTEEYYDANIKNMDVEVFSIGYDVAGNQYANEMLSYIASPDEEGSTIKHHISASAQAGSTDDIVSAFQTISQSIQESAAGLNATLSDGIGSAFTVTDGNNELVLDRISEDDENADSEGYVSMGSFEITIDPDTETGWHNTNDGFTLTYDTGKKDANGNPITKTIESNNNPEVYWKQAEYDYRIEYYYENQIDDNKTEEGTATLNTEISVTDKQIQDNSKENEGYELEKVEPNNKTITISKNSENVIKVYYKLKDIPYTVEYYYNNNKDNDATETGTAHVGDLISTYPDKVKKGYKLDRDTAPLTIKLNNGTTDNNVIKVYYVPDEKQTKELKYTVNYYKDNVKTNTDIETKVVQFLQPDTLNVDKTKINTNNKYIGYVFQKSIPKDIPEEIENDGVIDVYYVKDTFGYKIEYYYENEQDKNATEEKEAKYEDVISTYPDKVKTGYKLEKEENLPLTITEKESNNIIKIYYVIDDSQTKEISYTVEYYKDNVKVDDDTQIQKETVQVLQPDTLNVNKEMINTTDKYTGYKLDTEKTEEIPSTVNSGDVIKVYYIKDEFDYIIKHVESKNERNVLEEESGKALYDSEVAVSEKSYKGFTFESKDKEKIKIAIENNSAIVRYKRNSYNYTIKHVELGNENNVLETEEKEAKYEDRITVEEHDFTGFTYDSKDKDTIVIDTENNIATVYYKRNTYNYTVEYYKETIDGKYEIDDEATEEKEGLFEDNTEIEAKEFENYTLDENMIENADKTIPANDNLVIRLYYNLNESSVIVHYVIKVDDKYIPLDQYAKDSDGNITEDFKDIDLDDEVIIKKIGDTFTTTYRNIPEYTFVGIYNGDILVNSNLEKIDEKAITDTIKSYEQEYTYVYEPPVGEATELPPQTGYEISFNNILYIIVGLLFILGYSLKHEEN